MMYDLVGEWCAWLSASGRTSQTVSLRRHQLSRLIGDVPDVLRADGDALARWLAGHEWSASTLKSHRDAVRSFYAWAVLTRRLEQSPADVLGPVRVPAPMARPAPADIVKAALAFRDERVRLMVGLASRAGLRRGEIARVHSDDVERDLLGWSVVVHGKGGKVRRVPLVDGVAFELRRRESGWAFPGNDHGHLSPARVGELVSEALPGHWTCHTLRHYFATHAYGATHDVLVVQRLLGHAKPETTMGYVGLGFEALRAGVSWAA